MAIKMEALKHRLEKERDHLTEELKRLQTLQNYGEGIRSEDSGYGTHMAEDSSDTYEKEQRLSLERNLRTIHGEMERALHRMETGTYGLCESCRQPIEEGRLKALPYASLCLSCAERQSKRRPA
ncbi:MAG: TraR/DksA C4-type zinc finger protein [Dehalococcoidia bacterium]|nr:TraR/DksA C4-type zinc finger protein [Dehalococcoidia bacterium]